MACRAHACHAFELESRDTLLRAPATLPRPPLPVERLRVAGSVDIDGGLIHLDRASIMTARGSGDRRRQHRARARRTVDRQWRRPSRRCRSIRSKQIWPAGLQDGGRRWLLSQITGGMIRGGSLAAEIPAGALSGRVPLTRDMVRLEIELADVSFKTFDGMPNVQNADGLVVLAGTTFGADLTHAEIVAPTGDILELNGVAFAIDNTRNHGAGRACRGRSGRPDARLRAPSPTPIPSLRSISSTCRPRRSPGPGAARMSATWPLVDGMTMAEVEWFIDLDLLGLGEHRAPRRPDDPGRRCPSRHQPRRW